MIESYKSLVNIIINGKKFPCKCGHARELHFLQFHNTVFCRWTDGNITQCPCNSFNPDNLKFLEMKYEEVELWHKTIR